MELSGMAAMGKPIPVSRKEAAYTAAKQMGVVDPFIVIGQMVEQLERDKPFEAMKMGMCHVDITGVYRLFAHLLTDG